MLPRHSYVPLDGLVAMPTQDMCFLTNKWMRETEKNMHAYAPQTHTKRRQRSIVTLDPAYIQLIVFILRTFCTSQRTTRHRSSWQLSDPRLRDDIVQ